MGFIRRHYPAIIVVFLTLFLWEAFVKITNTPKWILPPPSKIIEALINEREILIVHAKVTIYEAVLGFVLAFIIAFILGILMDVYPFFKRGLYPILVTSQTIPYIILAPLFFIWFGFGILPKIIVVTLVAFFPIVINMIDGLNSADEGLITLMKSMNASKWQILFKIKLPASLPFLFSGLRIAATYSIMGAAIGEWLGASKGLGIYMKNASHSFLTDQVFAAIIIIVGASIAFYTILLYLEKKLVPWNKRKNEEY